MLRVMVIGAAVLALANPAAAAGRCNKPYAPVFKLSAKTTKEELATVRADVAAFVSASDVYQKCLTATGSQNLELAEANQATKEQIAGAFNAFAKAFRAAHPT